MKKGFTLIELLAVFIILGVIITITVPTVANIIRSSREKSYDEQIDLIENAARTYMADNSANLPDNNDAFTISVCELEREGLLTSQNIQNPIYAKDSNDNKRKCKYIFGNIIVTNTNDKFTYTYEDDNNCENYNDREDLETINICDILE